MYAAVLAKYKASSREKEYQLASLLYPISFCPGEPRLIIVLCVFVFLNHTKHHTNLPKTSQKTVENQQS